MNGKYEKIKDAVCSVLGKKRAFVSAVILAGGSGARMGPGEPKQMRLLCGKPLIAHTLLAFERCEYVDEIVLVARGGETGRYAEMCAQYGISKLARTVAGGKTRQQSAKLGFDAISFSYAIFHAGQTIFNRILTAAPAAYSVGASAPARRMIESRLIPLRIIYT